MRQRALKNIDDIGYKYNKITSVRVNSPVAKQKRVNRFLHTTLKLAFVIWAFIAAGNLLAEWSECWRWPL